MGRPGKRYLIGVKILIARFPHDLRWLIAKDISYGI